MSPGPGGDVGPRSEGSQRAVHPGAPFLRPPCLIPPCPRRWRSRQSRPVQRHRYAASWELAAVQAGVAGSPPKHPGLALVTQHYHFIIL